MKASGLSLFRALPMRPRDKLSQGLYYSGITLPTALDDRVAVVHVVDAAQDWA